MSYIISYVSSHDSLKCFSLRVIIKYIKVKFESIHIKRKISNKFLPRYSGIPSYYFILNFKKSVIFYVVLNLSTKTISDTYSSLLFAFVDLKMMDNTQCEKPIMKLYIISNIYEKKINLF